MFDNLRLQMLAHGLRISTGLMIGLAGLNKLLGANMYAGAIENISGLSMIKDFLIPALPWMEVILGLMLVLGLFTQVAAVLLAILFLGMSIFAGFTSGGGIGLQFHFYAFLTSLSLALGGTQNGPTLDSVLKKKFGGKVEKIKV